MDLLQLVLRDGLVLHTLEVSPHELLKVLPVLPLELFPPLVRVAPTWIRVHPFPPVPVVRPSIRTRVIVVATPRVVPIALSVKRPSPIVVVRPSSVPKVPSVVVIVVRGAVVVWIVVASSPVMIRVIATIVPMSSSSIVVVCISQLCVFARHAFLLKSVF